VQHKQQDTLISDEFISAAAPASGQLIPLSEMPDENFSQGYLGDGVAILPTSSSIVAPFDGTIVHTAETKHAIIIKHISGLQLLIHIGIDTVQLHGQGFSQLVNSGSQVIAGQPLITFDEAFIRAAGYETYIIIVAISSMISQTDHIANVTCRYRKVSAAEPNAFSIRLIQRSE